MKLRSALRSGALLGCVLTLAGCKALVPYDSKFMCEANADFGRCMSVSEAYQESLTGSVPNEADQYPDVWDIDEQNRSKPRQKRQPKARGDARPLNASLSSRDVYKDSEYREMASLIEAPATPIVRPPKVLRTLIVSYPAGETLYMPRYIVYFAEEARFVVGDYLNETRPAGDTVFPNGKRQ